MYDKNIFLAVGIAASVFFPEKMPVPDFGTCPNREICVVLTFSSLCAVLRACGASEPSEKLLTFVGG